jgi:hypothetical protein
MLCAVLPKVALGTESRMSHIQKMLRDKVVYKETPNPLSHCVIVGSCIVWQTDAYVYSHADKIGGQDRSFSLYIFPCVFFSSVFFPPAFFHYGDPLHSLYKEWRT